jgi:hypothetical protein
MPKLLNVLIQMYFSFLEYIFARRWLFDLPPKGTPHLPHHLSQDRLFSGVLYYAAQVGPRDKRR